ncbi:antibiotic biosynthesis monooxygenase [Halanaerobiaceae bacterium Z-7014]|uniref:Antibiotic biosynthesis monooxygenase n=1 Tax=Halonatronomonas betaini TaxID=2778430 RepID=A0A931F8M1_9FIRM|nr:putative quinol monooxygenase [Halonatronomonas betaini]MBF8435524.1 antibiotic biosynthesis monooxygenase [Halonatronomonas betaini]
MIKVVAKFIVQEDKIQVFKDRVVDLIEKTRQEEGNIFYELYQDANNPQILTFIEEWESQEALKEHMGTDHFQETVPELEDLLIEEMDEVEINIYKLFK